MLWCQFTSGGNSDERHGDFGTHGNDSVVLFGRHSLLRTTDPDRALKGWRKDGVNQMWSTRYQPQYFPEQFENKSDCAGHSFLMIHNAILFFKSEVKK